MSFDDFMAGNTEPTQQPKSDFDKFVTNTDQQANQQLKASMDIGQSANADRQGRIFKMQVRTGLPKQFIDQNLDAIEKKAASADFNPDYYRKHSPEVAKFLADPDNAKLSHDDVSNLSGLEWLMKAPQAAYQEGSDQLNASLLNYKAMTRGLDVNEQKTLNDLESQQPDGFGAHGWLQTALIDTAKQIPMLENYISSGLKGAIPGALAAGGAAFLAGGEVPPVGAITVPSAAITGASTGFLAGTAYGSYQMNAGAAYQEFKNYKDKNGQLLDPQVAQVAASMAGAINSGLDIVNFGALAKTVPGAEYLKNLTGTGMVKLALRNPTVVDALKTFASRYAGAVSVQTIANTSQQLVQMIAGEAAKQYQGGFAKADKAAMADQLLKTADTSLKVASLLSLPGPAMSFFGDYAKTRQAHTNKEIMQNLGNVANDSKTLKRAPEKLKSLMKNIKENSPIKNVYIPVDRWRELFQSENLDPQAMSAEVLNDGGKQYAEAETTGGDLIIPIEDYTSILAGSQWHERLLDDMRLDPEQMTNREALEWEADRQASAQDAIERAADAVTPGDGTDFIFNDVVDQLKQTGADRGEAEAQALQMQSVIRTLSDRTGIDAKTLWKRYGPTIRRELPENLKNSGGDFDIAIDPLIDRLRTGELPSERETFGPSIMERLRERGIEDEGGELANRDVDKNLKPFQKRLIRERGIEGEQPYTLDEAAQIMAEQGYLRKDIGDVTQNDLLDAIDKEMSGDPVYSDQLTNEKARQEYEFLNSLQDYLDQSNIDLDQYTNEQIKDILNRPEVEGRGYDQERRGRLTINDQGFQISLFDKSDLSTVLHESGHLYLEVLTDLERRGELPESMLKDLDTVRDWVGNKGGNFTTEQHETFARGFEAYLREGKAPSVGLQRAFAKFRAWLIQIYKNVKNLRVNLNDDVRQVFDRLIATDEEIKNAESLQDYQRLFENADEAGMTEKQFEDYKNAVLDARDDAESSIAAQRYRQLKEREQADTRKITNEVFAEISQQPVYQAISYLRRGKLYGQELPEGIEPVKLSKDALVELKGESWLKRLPKGLYRREGGSNPDDVASMFGYSSGDEMLQDMVNSPDLNDAVTAEVQRRLDAEYGNLYKDGTLPEKAMKATHNDARGKVIAMELRALAKRSNINGKPTPSEILKEAARVTIAKKKVSDTHSRAYLSAERKAANLAQQEAAKGNIDEAARQKQKQLLNFHLYRAARDAEEAAEKNRTYLDKFSRPSYQQRLGKAGQDYLDAVNQLLEKTDFKRVSLAEIQRRKDLSQFILEQEQNGFSVDIPEKLMYQSGLTNWRDMTNEELSGLRDSVQNIYHIARFKDKLLANKEKMEFDAVVDDIVGSIEANNNLREDPQKFYDSKLDKLKEGASGYVAWHTKMEFLFEMLDGKALGPLWRALFKPLADAEDNELVMNQRYTKEFNEIMSAYSSKERASWYKQTRHIENIGKFNKARAIGLALNWGNTGNRDAVLNGFYRLDGKKWSESDVNRIFRTFLDKRDWDTVQKIWDMIDKLWPDIADLQRDLTGVVPEKVDAAPISTDFGEYRGGYYPLKADKNLSFKAFVKNEVSTTKELFETNFARPATRKGHTIERTAFGGMPVRLDLNVIGEHLNEAIHDLTHRRAIMDVDRLSRNKKVQNAIAAAVGDQMYKQIRPWLQGIAGDNQTMFSAYERILGHLRSGATVVNMGIKITTALAQPFGFLQSIDELGAAPIIKEIYRFYGKPHLWNAHKQFVMDRSVMMQNRQKMFDRDVRDSINGMAKNSRLSDIQKGFFYFTGAFDMGVSVPTWMAAYRKAMDGNIENINAGDEQRAIEYADRTVRVTQYAGGAKDLARIQRGGQTFRLFTMFYSYMNGLFNTLLKRGYQLKLGQMSKPAFIASMMYVWIAPSVLTELAADRGPDKNEPWWEWAAKNIASYPFQTVVGVRDLASSFGSWGFEASPVFDALGSTSKGLKALGKISEGDDLSRSDVKNLVLSTSYWGHLPGRQAWITGSYMYDVAAGNEHPQDPLEFVKNMAFARQENK